jgi:Ser/Thr protein kinase RdoA (MazF antagonist)
VTAPDRAVVAFDVRGSAVSVEPHPTGHINDAYLVANERGRYLLQRLNPSVFGDADAVMANVATVTRHLRAKGEPTLTLVATKDGDQSWRDAEGAMWRLYEYIEAVLPLAVDSPHDAALLGRTFGRFHRLLGDLDPARLGVSLPRFHDPGRRVAQLQSASESDRCGRLGETAALVDELIDMQRVVDVDDAFAGLPTRVAHNDAKAANVLVGDRTATVVDLDTVMPGSVLWDVGDMVRSSTGTAEEASATVSFDVERYRALVEAWLAEVGDLLRQDERDAVPKAGPVVTFEQAVRFLTDHLRGDVYFRVDFPGQNLDRARNQIELLRSMASAL